LGRHGATLETRLLTTQNSTQLMPSIINLSQYEPNQAQKENALNILLKIPSASCLYRCSRSAISFRNRKVNWYCSGLRRWSDSCDSCLLRIFISSLMLKNGFSRTRCHLSSSEFIEKKWNKSKYQCLI
jgi:hypothetical protein